ncbi:hypothetical protein ZWY2020_005001 [Hordeum vulgare]|nr:hypothetical protein ZWY2020_005001 [Hordeum vulgare]
MIKTLYPKTSSSLRFFNPPTKHHCLYYPRAAAAAAVSVSVFAVPTPSAVPGRQPSRTPRAMTSLISQNALRKRRLEKGDSSSDDEETMGSPVASDAEAGKKPGPDGRKNDRRRKKKALQARLGQEADEMKLLESSLFGNI